MRRLLLAVLLALAGLAVQAPLAYASHSYSTIEVRQVDGYRHVLEENDRLFLVYYILVESTPGQDEEAYGAAGGVLALESGSTVLARQTPPSSGYAVAAFYQEADDAVTWVSDQVKVVLKGNPLLFDTPQSSQHYTTWNFTQDREGTSTLLESHLPELMKELEDDDSEVEEEDYVQDGKITDLGAGVLTDAFRHLPTVMPGVFISTFLTIAQDVAIPTPGAHASSVEEEGLDSEFTRDLEALGEAFGIPIGVMGILLLGALLALSSVAMIKLGGSAAPMIIFTGPILLVVALMGPIHLAVVGLITALVFVVGVGLVIQRVVPS